MFRPGVVSCFTGDLMAKRGRPTTYFDLVQPHLADIHLWASQGWTREEIAAKLGINRLTLYRYSEQHSELSTALKTGDAEIVTNVAAALAKKALAGDVVAMIFFLKNKDPKNWRDKQDLRVSGNMTYREMVAAKKLGGGDDSSD